MGKELTVIEGQVVKTGNVNIENLLTMGVTNGLPVETMERLMAMRTQLKQEHAKEQFYLALSKFQSETPAITKTKDVLVNGKLRYSYAPLESIVEQVKDKLKDNGFSYTLKTEQTDKAITVICEAHHLYGHTEQTRLTVPVAATGHMSAIQEIGSALTYAKRYTFCNAFGILTADEDDDNVEPEPAGGAVKGQATGSRTASDADLAQDIIIATMNDKFKGFEVSDKEKTEIFHMMYSMAKGSAMTDYEKKSITSIRNVSNMNILKSILKQAEDFQVAVKA